eukprot:UN27790
MLVEPLFKKHITPYIDLLTKEVDPHQEKEEENDSHEFSEFDEMPKKKLHTGIDTSFFDDDDHDDKVVLKYSQAKKLFLQDGQYNVKDCEDLLWCIQELKRRKELEDEFDVEMKKLFDYIDADLGGKLSVDELQPYFPKANKSLLKSLDADGDGELDMKEFKVFSNRQTDIPMIYHNYNRSVRVWEMQLQP